MFIQSDNSVDAIHEVCSNDHDLFFGPNPAEPITFTCSNLEHILVTAGLASSLTWCRKNGWSRELKPGYQEFIFSKRRTRICVLNRS